MNRSSPHDSAVQHVSGIARYVDDIPVPADCLHLCFGLSDVAHGEIKSLDVEAVRNAPGVVAVYTSADFPDADVSPAAHDEPLLAKDTVEYLGQPMFLVVATSHLAARKAARLGKADIAPRPAILTIEAAQAADSRFEEGPRIWSHGDANAAIDAADHIVTGQVEIGGQEHFYLEGQAALALPGEHDDMVVHSSTQHPTEIQHKVAHALHVPMHSVRVEVRRMGGGFGGKESQANALAVAVALAARATGRPCKMRYDRDDDIMITGKRHPFRIAYRVGLAKDGRVMGMDVVQHAICGWAQDLSIPVADRAMLHADNTYDLPNVRIESHRWRTHTQSATAYRGFGGPQGMAGVERIMDHAAHALGMDPIAIREVNYYPERDGGASAPQRAATPRPPEGISTNKTGSTPYGMDVEDFIMRQMQARLLESSDYAARRAAVDAWNAENEVMKKGLAFSPVKFGISFTLTHLNQAGALVHVYQDGSVQVNHGGTEMGQGLFQKVAGVAAHVFGVPLDVIRPTATDTGKVPNTSATAASSGSDLNGMAVLRACETIRERMVEYFAQSRGVAVDDVRFEDGQVHIGDEVLSFADAARETHEARVSLSATGFYATPDLSWNRIEGSGRPFLYFAYGCAVTEVVIDTLTGENRMLRADLLHDTGLSLNPALDIGQVEGAFVQGVGWLTTEELVWDDSGRLRTHAPSTYKIPACSDRPDVFNVALWDQPNPAPTVRRSKAVGEPPFMLGLSAWLALSDAVSACGPNYPDLQAPATAEEILNAIARARG